MQKNRVKLSSFVLTISILGCGGSGADTQRAHVTEVRVESEAVRVGEEIVSKLISNLLK